ncbi:hypothetical protein KIN20_031040 [Parelaphostrongylus tenuis]|uniref:Uncharacterized protein n=1 Tax=Parelaphostrongylus tenuis TaxID=148309 RepID=A0AAD5R697_PARTN|nr:hypothetical protein KIN20_031040 [Parelaphostrongylus tenuis]
MVYKSSPKLGVVHLLLACPAEEVSQRTGVAEVEKLNSPQSLPIFKSTFPRSCNQRSRGLFKTLLRLLSVPQFFTSRIGAARPSGCDARRGGMEQGSTPPLSGSQQQRPMELHSKAVLEIARRLVQPVFFTFNKQAKNELDTRNTGIRIVKKQ